MLRIHKLIVMLALLIAVALMSGCYTIVGYPPEVEEGIIKEEATEGQVYRYYEPYHDYPYARYWDYYDPYHSLWYPYSYYYYRDYPWWRYYDDYYYRDYDRYYVPKKKPETKRRGASELRRAPSRASRSGASLKDEEEKQPSREIKVRQGAKDRTREPVRKKHRDSVSSSPKRSAKREPQDEEEK